ncbi:MAG TPA: ImmA/IrrE family metallo-endopeptidase [Polyangiales bacterium]|nr:ImmA/IrrE family metallo-endopeptidase [Polyangiales bacterium]
MARRLSRPRQIGRDLLVRVGARTPDQIDPIETAKELGIQVTFGHLKGATARIFRVGAKARIRVSDDIVTKGRQRVAIAHEVGHFALDHELPTEGEPASWFKASCEHRSKRDERDADILAIEHLTPAPMAAPYCGVTPVDLHAVKVIERVFTASPVMGAMRFAELSPEACAAVYSERGVMKWMKPSRTFPTYVEGGKTLARESIAAGFFDRGTLIDVPTRLPAFTWLGSSKQVAPELEIIEHAMVIPEPGWGGVLSLLWLPNWKPLRTAGHPRERSLRA